MSFTRRLKALFSSAPARPSSPKAKPSKTYVTSTTDRAAVIAEAMAIHRRERDAMRAGLDRAMDDLRAQAPKLLRDPDGMARLLALHRAHQSMRTALASDQKRFLVLSGMRELLGDIKLPGPKRAKSPPKR